MALTADLGPNSRAAALKGMSDHELDVLVVGGGEHDQRQHGHASSVPLGSREPSPSRSTPANKSVSGTVGPTWLLTSS